MSGFNFEKIIQLSKDKTKYRLLTSDFVSTEKIGDREILTISPEAIEKITNEGFHDIGHYLRASHLKKLSQILEDSEASENDRF